MLYRILFLVLSLASSARAFPTGAGSCNPNPLKSPHKTTFSGRLNSYGSTSVTIAGKAPSSSSRFSIKAGTTFPIVLSSTMEFEGFLIRISKLGVNTSAYLGRGTSTNVQVPTICTSQRLGGLTHINKTGKKSVRGTIRIPSVGSGFTLHVTIVVNKKQAYQSVFTVNAVS